MQSSARLANPISVAALERRAPPQRLSTTSERGLWQNSHRRSPTPARHCCTATYAPPNCGHIPLLTVTKGGYDLATPSRCSACRLKCSQITRHCGERAHHSRVQQPHRDCGTHCSFVAALE